MSENYPVNIFRILSDNIRLRILLLLHHKELCVCEICDILQISQPKVSRHLAKLRDCGFVTITRNRQWVFYQLNNDNTDATNQFLQDVLGQVLLHIPNGNFPDAASDIKVLRKKEKGNELCNREINKKE